MACPAFTKKKVKPGSLGWQVGKRHKDVLVMEEGKTGSHCNLLKSVAICKEFYMYRFYGIHIKGLVFSGSL